MNNDDVVIVAAARTPQGRLKGALSSLTAVQLGSAAIRGALERGGIPADSVDAVLVGQVLAAGCRPERRSPGRGRRGDRLERARLIRQQGLPLGAHRDHRRCPDAAPGRRDGRRRRGHGVDDARPAPAAGLARRLGLRHRRGARPHGARRTHRRLRPREHGRLDRAAQPEVRDHARGSGCRGRSLAPARRRGPGRGRVRRRARAGDDPAAQGRPGRRDRRRGGASRDDRRDARRAARRPSPRAAPSRRATPRRSRTAPPPSC